MYPEGVSTELVDFMAFEALAATASLFIYSVAWLPIGRRGNPYHVEWTQRHRYFYLGIAQAVAALPLAWALVTGMAGLLDFWSAAKEWIDLGGVGGWGVGVMSVVGLISPLLSAVTWLWIYAHPAAPDD